MSYSIWRDDNIIGGQLADYTGVVGSQVFVIWCIGGVWIVRVNKYLYVVVLLPNIKINAVD